MLTRNLKAAAVNKDKAIESWIRPSGQSTIDISRPVLLTTQKGGQHAYALLAKPEGIGPSGVAKSHRGAISQRSK